MSAIKLHENLWSVGVLNPTLRVFDIVMESKYGTSYNAYLLTGEKNVLIETVHTDYFEEYVDNIRQIIPLEDVDYLIMNHNEPDHSGSVSKLLASCPKLEIIATKAGKKHLQDITNNPNLPCRAVAAGDTLHLGDRVLEFIPAPMLHWADSMFTWDSKDKTLFTCDFLGCHFCEPTMLDRKIHAKEAYEGEFAYYYAGIFGPFKPHVLAGLDKMPAEAQLVCPSHGPCLTETIARAKELYRIWSTPEAKNRRTAFVVYASAYGYTRTLAETAAKTLEEEGYAVTLADVTVASPAYCVEMAHKADVLLVGSPTINRAAPKAVWDVLTSIDPINLKGKAAGAFGAYGWSGEAAPMLHSFLTQLRYATPEAPFRVLFTPTQADLDAMADYARSIAALCTVPVDAPKAEGEKWVCSLCGYIYDPAEGDAAHGVAAGTLWEQVPATWCCPLCGVDKDMFKKAE